jgi:beta-1,4-mannosyl-glycoprotein beta-1,4-N-acetylglucosaminyltransferase
MTYDTFSFFNELDLLEIRLNILDPYVDFFVLCESNKTFSGMDKPLVYKGNRKRFSKWNKKIIHLIVDDYPSDQRICELMDSRDYVPKDMPHFRRAFYQKESIKRGLMGLKDNDICYYGDVDEIWKPQFVDDDRPYKLWQTCYSYFLNNRSSEKWAGTVVTRYKNIKNGCLNDLRADPKFFLENGGWHFTNMGGVEAIRKKIESYDHQEFNTESVKSQIRKRFEKNEDFLGRKYDYSGKKFKFIIDERDLPSYLISNKDKYSHLFKKV